jgi:hypothetical protein
LAAANAIVGWRRGRSSRRCDTTHRGASQRWREGTPTPPPTTLQRSSPRGEHVDIILLVGFQQQEALDREWRSIDAITALAHHLHGHRRRTKTYGSPNSPSDFILMHSQNECQIQSGKTCSTIGRLFCRVLIIVLYPPHPAYLYVVLFPFHPPHSRVSTGSTSDPPPTTTTTGFGARETARTAPDRRSRTQIRPMRWLVRHGRLRRRWTGAALVLLLAGGALVLNARSLRQHYQQPLSSWYDPLHPPHPLHPPPPHLPRQPGFSRRGRSSAPKMYADTDEGRACRRMFPWPLKESRGSGATWNALADALLRATGSHPPEHANSPRYQQWVRELRAFYTPDRLRRSRAHPAPASSLRRILELINLRLDDPVATTPSASWWWAAA